MHTNTNSTLNKFNGELHGDNTEDLPDFVFFEEVGAEKEERVEEVNKKHKPNLPSTSVVLVLHSKDIQSFIGPSDLFLVKKGMKLDNTKVTTIKFIGNVPRQDIERYISRRPNLTKVIMDSYGPVCCTWTEFDVVRKNLKSFVVRSGARFVDVCDFIAL